MKLFLENELIIDGVVRNLEIIGEASNRLPEDVKIISPFIPWSDLRGLRNRIVHDYFGIDYQVIWTIIEEELDELISNLEFLLNKIK